jgi:putative nucleotidyltransferase with HDIG domain
MYLNEYIIEKFKNFGIRKVKVFHTKCPENELEASEAKRIVHKKYIESVDLIKKAVCKLTIDKELDYQLITEAAETVYSSINENNAILMCINEIKYTDDYTYKHCVNTAFYAMLISKWLDLSEADTKLAIQSGLLHDLGKISISPKVLNKVDKLTPLEFDMIKLHTVLGYNLVKDIKEIAPEVKQAVLLHHERMDKTGYPSQVSPKEINIFSRIISVADVYDAMTSVRVYKNRSTPFEAIEMFKTIGVSMFDSNILNKFLWQIANCYVGAKVLLKNRLYGEIAYIPPHDLTNPIIKLAGKYVEMMESEDYCIVDMQNDTHDLGKEA